MNRIGLSQRLQLRQSQSLVMTPQLQQAIKLLQLSNLELSEFVEAEIEKNPLLELGEPQRDEAPSGPGEPGPPAPDAPVTLPEQLAGGVGEVAGDAAEHWEAASGESGDGSHRSRRRGRFVAAPGRVRPRRRHRTGHRADRGAVRAACAST